MKRDELRQLFTRVRPMLWLGALGWIVIALAQSSLPRAGESQRPLAGQMLVATPEMQDPRFVETVIYLAKHDATGAFGLVINRPLAKGPIGELLKSFGVDSNDSRDEIVINYGGPVGERQGFILHSDDVMLKDSLRVKDGIAMTADPKLIEAAARGKGPKQLLFMLGYAGWAPGQLEGEIDANAWYVIAADKAIVFGKEAEKKWRQAVDKRQIPL